MVWTKAYAKVNLCLEILGIRPDGYHEIKTVLQTIDLYDWIYVKRSSWIKVECTDPKLSGDKNLAWWAIHALNNFTGKKINAEIFIRKAIPIGMGLGGGSSDAAATLRLMNKLFGLSLDGKSLHAIASSLGADVPFFLNGGTALGQSRGDQISTLPDLIKRWVVLLVPTMNSTDVGARNIGKTAQLYSMIRPVNYTDGSATIRLVDSLISAGDINPELFNVFEKPALSVFPDLGSNWSSFRCAGAKYVQVCGSGPAMFTVADSYKHGRNIAQNLKNMGFTSYCLYTIPSDGIKT